MLGGTQGLYAVTVPESGARTAPSPATAFALPMLAPHGCIATRPYREDDCRPTYERLRAVFGADRTHRLTGSRIPDSLTHQSSRDFLQEVGFPEIEFFFGLNTLPLTATGLKEVDWEQSQGAELPGGGGPFYLLGEWIEGVLCLDGASGMVRRAPKATALDAGPAGLADLERWAEVTSAGYARRDGVFAWVGAAEAQVELRSLDGTAVTGQAIPILDVTSLAFATGAPNVEFAFAVGESAGSRRGEGPSVEVRIDLEGVGPTGAPLSINRYVVHPGGQRPLTSLGLALGVERLLGLRGDAVAPGIHTPEVLLDPAYVVEQLIDVGTTFVDA